jgi:succinate dehydrogenase/fumarate reductase flavoprotein subunit
LDETMIKDVIVVGSGSAGMTAAIVAARLGRDVLLVEKAAVFGGATAWSGGGAWIPNNHLMSQLGLNDTREGARKYIQALMGDYYDGELIDSFLDNCSEAIRFLDRHSEVKFVPAPVGPDFREDLEGWTAAGRFLTPTVFNGRELGSYFGKLRPPLTQFNAPFGMMVSYPDAMQLMNASKSWTAFKYSAKILTRFAKDKMLYGRATRLIMGNALAARLLKSALDAKVELWSRAEARSLVYKDGRVTGINVIRDGNEITITARRGVVLATGGFSADPAKRKTYFPYIEQHQSMMPDENTGDGQRMAASLGAAIGEYNANNAVWAVTSVLHHENGTSIPIPHFFLDIPKPGCIAVNQKGQRFGNEASYNLVRDMHRSAAVPAYLICDRKFIKKYGLGYVLPGGWRLAAMKRRGYVTEAPTLHELASRLRISPSGLDATVARMNAFALTGKDDDFGKGSTPQSRSMGDPLHKPNPCLGQIVHAPFYGLAIFPGDTGNTVGLKIDGRGRVCNKSDGVIPGLFACGLDSNSIWRGAEPAGGAFIGANLTFGYIVGAEVGRPEQG